MKIGMSQSATFGSEYIKMLANQKISKVCVKYGDAQRTRYKAKIPPNCAVGKILNKAYYHCYYY